VFALGLYAQANEFRAVNAGPDEPSLGEIGTLPRLRTTAWAAWARRRWPDRREDEECPAPEIVLDIATGPAASPVGQAVLRLGCAVSSLEVEAAAG
jgi:hypothetical protein